MLLMLVQLDSSSSKSPQAELKPYLLYFGVNLQ